MHVVRSPVARAAAAIGTRTRYRGSAARGRRRAFPRPLRLGEIFPYCLDRSYSREKSPRGQPSSFRPSCDRVQLISAVWDLTSPVKIYIIIIVHIHTNEHEFYCVDCSWARRRPARGRRSTNQVFGAVPRLNEWQIDRPRVSRRC